MPSRHGRGEASNERPTACTPFRSHQTSLNQDFNATGLNQKWGADISYVWTRVGWLYLAVVIDLFARRASSAGPPATGSGGELALLAPRRAVAVRCPSAGLIHHADRGSQYCSVEYQAELEKKNGISISMSGKGKPLRTTPWSRAALR